MFLYKRIFKVLSLLAVTLAITGFTVGVQAQKIRKRAALLIDKSAAVNDVYNKCDPGDAMAGCLSAMVEIQPYVPSAKRGEFTTLASNLVFPKKKRIRANESNTNMSSASMTVNQAQRQPIILNAMVSRKSAKQIKQLAKEISKD